MQKECNQLLIKQNSNGSFINNTGCIIEPTFDIPNGLYLSSSYIQHRKQLKLNEIVSKYIVGEFINKTLRELTNSEQIFLLNEQYIVKPSKSKNTAFEWHQDCNYLPQPNLYISVWIPLDDISNDNGSIFMVPFDNKLDKKSWKIPSLLLKDEEINELQNKTNCDKSENEASSSMEQDIKQNENESTKKIKPTLQSNKIQLLPKVGDMIIFTSYTYHKSNPNISNKMRRVIMTQYSTFPIIDRMNKKLARLVVKL